jgi:hypothetical protein
MITSTTETTTTSDYDYDSITVSTLPNEDDSEFVTTCPSISITDASTKGIVHTLKIYVVCILNVLNFLDKIN